MLGNPLQVDRYLPGSSQLPNAVAGSTFMAARTPRADAAMQTTTTMPARAAALAGLEYDALREVVFHQENEEQADRPPGSTEDQCPLDDEPTRW